MGATRKLTVVSPGGDLRSRRKPKKTQMLTCNHVAMCLGVVCVALLSLSLLHVSEAIAALTGSWRVTSLLLDAGMLMCECAEILTDDRRVRGLSVGCVGLSATLNAYSFSCYAPISMRWAAIGLGLAIPALMFAFGRVAVMLHRQE